jgi:hypothetical protein
MDEDDRNYINERTLFLFDIREADKGATQAPESNAWAAASEEMQNANKNRDGQSQYLAHIEKCKMCALIESFSSSWKQYLVNILNIHLKMAFNLRLLFVDANCYSELK